MSNVRNDLTAPSTDLLKSKHEDLTNKDSMAHHPSAQRQAKQRGTHLTHLNRRRFLEMAALGVGSVGLWGSQMHTAMAATTQSSKSSAVGENMSGFLASDSDNINQSLNKRKCITPTITTRIFSSSNTSVDESRNVRGLARMACAGFDIQNKEVTRRQYLRFGGTDQQRASDLQNIATGAIKAPELLLAARGGYGAMRLLEQVDWESLGRVLKEQQTILVGFSDVTAVQCALLAKGKMSSLAGPMLYSEFGKEQPDIVSCQGFVEAITNPNLMLSLSEQLQTSSQTLTKPTTGTIWGGNLSVVSALAGSEYIPNPDGGIVFLEDVGEQPYQVERMLYSLYLSGAFKNQQAIVLGTFTGTGSDSYDGRYNMDMVVKQLKKLTGLPIYTGLHFGHVSNKQSFPLGAICTLTPLSDGKTAIEFSDYPTIDGERIYAEGLWS